MQLWKKSGDRAAVFDAACGRWWSRAELAWEADRLGALMPSRKSLVFCFCRNDLGSLIWYLACLRAGHTVALLDAGLAEDLREKLIAQYSPDCIAGPVPVDESVGERMVLGIGGQIWVRHRPLGGTLHPEVSLLLSTSGSTGSAKLVRLTEANVQSNAASICEGLAIVEEDCAITSLPLHYSYGLSVVNTHLMAGGRLVLSGESMMTEGFWHLFRQQQCTSFAGVPYSYQMLRRLNLDKLNVPSLRTLTQAGGRLQNELIAEFHHKMSQRGGRFFVMYGQTEATARISILPADRLPEKIGSAGVAIAGGRLAVDTADGLSTEAGRVGELVYTGPNVMMGYATCREDLARGDELAGHLPTGDSAWFDEQGFVHIAGRRKRDAKVFGLRLNLDEIESLLRVHGPTAVVAGGGGLRIFCEYGDKAALGRIRLELAATLNLHHQALSLERISQLPLNANGKVDYQALEQR